MKQTTRQKIHIFICKSLCQHQRISNYTIKLKKKYMESILNILLIDQVCWFKNIKKRGGTYKGKENKSSGLNRWFNEKWTNQRGETGYKNKSDVYRPTVKVNKDTPTTFKELTQEQIEKAKTDKARTGKVEKSLINNFKCII